MVEISDLLEGGREELFKVGWLRIPKSRDRVIS